MKATPDLRCRQVQFAAAAGECFGCGQAAPRPGKI